MERSLRPEILDQLAPGEPSAQRSRRDLFRINAVMGNVRWLRCQLDRFVRPGERVLEIGAGDGSLGDGGHEGRHDGLDLWPRPAHWPGRSRWHQVDVLKFERWAEYPVVCGNLIFHHFTDEVLGQLGAKIREHARVVLACEPVRARLFQLLFAGLCPLIGADEITCHDGDASIAAGFKGNELAERLGLRVEDWRYRVHETMRGAYHLIAVRR